MDRFSVVTDQRVNRIDIITQSKGEVYLKPPSFSRMLVNTSASLEKIHGV